MLTDVSLAEGPIDTAALRRALSDPDAGAVLLFEGCPRTSHPERPVTDLLFEAYVPMAYVRLDQLRKEALARFALKRCLVHHRLGAVPLGEAAVAVALAAVHRRETFLAAAWIMDALKTQVPIWKRERYADGSEAWVEDPPTGSSSGAAAPGRR
jgi:molybdopterin synthase catalytic subunit